MKTKSIFFSAVLISALFMQLNAQTLEKPVRALSVTDSTKVMLEDSLVTITFDKYSYDFGTIKASNGTVTTIFTFTNESDSTLVISKVAASCGCTTPEWTREPVAPGEKGFVKAIYKPSNETYFFSKTLSVYSNGHPSKVVLFIHGNVVKQ